MGSNGRKQYSWDPKRVAVSLVTQERYPVRTAARNLGTHVYPAAPVESGCWDKAVVKRFLFTQGLDF